MKTLITIIAVVVSVSVNAQQKVKTYKVLAACGLCQFDMNSTSGCSLAIQTGGKTYWVDGSILSDHGDEHAEDGMCYTIRKAEITGDFSDKRFKATSFVLIPNKKKKGKE